MNAPGCHRCYTAYQTLLAENREYTLDCLDEDGQRYIVIHTDLLEAVCELAVLLGCDLSDV